MLDAVVAIVGTLVDEPLPLVVLSRVGSWNMTMTSSVVMCTSVSRPWSHRGWPSRSWQWCFREGGRGAAMTPALGHVGSKVHLADLVMGRMVNGDAMRCCEEDKDAMQGRR